MTELFLVRHGQTCENVGQILQGHLPGRLTDEGRAQAARLCEKLSKEPEKFDVMVSSDLARAVETAELLNAELRLPFHLTPLLRERDWGSLTGMVIPQEGIADFPDDVESVEAMFRRAEQFFIYLKNRFPGQRILAVGHGLFNRVVLAVSEGKTIREILRMENVEIRHCVIPERLAGSAKGESAPDELFHSES